MALFLLLMAVAGPVPQTGRFVFPPGVTVVKAPIEVPAGAHDLEIAGHAKGSTLRAAPGFRGSAIIRIRKGNGVTIRSVRVEGNRRAATMPVELPPSNVPFIRFHARNGIAIEDSSAVVVRGVRFREIAGFAVLVSGSKQVRIENVHVADSGSRNAKRRNNTTGGILLEEGTSEFAVTGSTFTNVLGNGVWTHSNYGSPRNGPGRVAVNQFREIGRDAIQVGHATAVIVEKNTGTRIGFPADAVDVENGATPVAIDTAGDVDRTEYRDNRFTELNGKCIDLDGFHDGAVEDNTCVNSGVAEDYPHGHFGIVVNNWNPDMQSRNIVIRRNTIDGAKFGGLFLIGSHHRVEDNRFLRLNLAGCNESAARFGCVAIQGEPAVLEAGIYLGRIAAEWAQKRADASRGHVIRNNTITGHRMRERCILAAPGVDAKSSTIENNTCQDTTP